MDYLFEGAVSLEYVAAGWAVDAGKNGILLVICVIVSKVSGYLQHDGWVAMDLELGSDRGEAGAVNSGYSDWGVVEGLGDVVEYWF